MNLSLIHIFQTGTDEHGQKIEEKANAAGITPKEYVDNVAKIVKANWDVMNTSYDKFIRTTDDYHEKQVQKIFKKLYEQGDIYKGHYEGMYCCLLYTSWYPRNMYIEGSKVYEHHIKTYGAHKDFGYKDFIPMFKAEKFDPNAWAALFKKAGAKYVVPVAEHHDGFQMYRSNISHWNAYEMGCLLYTSGARGLAPPRAHAD